MLLYENIKVCNSVCKKYIYSVCIKCYIVCSKGGEIEIFL